MQPSRAWQYVPVALLALTATPPKLYADSPLTEKAIGSYVPPIASDEKYRAYMCDFCGDKLDQRFRELIEKTNYSGEWYAVDIPDGNVRRYRVDRNTDQVVIKEEAVDEGTRKYIKAAKELFDVNHQSYDVKLTIDVDLPSK